MDADGHGRRTGRAHQDTAVWTGDVMIVWGGDNHLVNLNTIGRYVAHAGEPCDDGDSCTTNDTCDLAGLCGGGSRTNCDDGNVCTADACDAAAACFAIHGTADLDMSGFSAHRVDGYDLVVLADAWNSCPGDPEYNAAANLDQGATLPGSCVDERDFHFYMNSFGQSCPSPR